MAEMVRTQYSSKTEEEPSLLVIPGKSPALPSPMMAIFSAVERPLTKA